MGTVAYVVRGKKTGVFGIRKGQVVVAKTTGNQPVSSHAPVQEARSVACGARFAPTCWGAAGQGRRQALQGLGLNQRLGASLRLDWRLCRLRSS